MSVEKELAGLRATVEAKFESITNVLLERKEWFDKLFKVTDEIKDDVRKFNGKVAEVRADCEQRCTATEAEVRVWRKVTYFVVTAVILGGSAAAVLALIGR